MLCAARGRRISDACCGLDGVAGVGDGGGLGDGGLGDDQGGGLGDGGLGEDGLAGANDGDGEDGLDGLAGADELVSESLSSPPAPAWSSLSSLAMLGFATDSVVVFVVAAGLTGVVGFVLCSVAGTSGSELLAAAGPATVSKTRESMRSSMAGSRSVNGMALLSAVFKLALIVPFRLQTAPP